jgi:hypothetical protein
MRNLLGVASRRKQQDEGRFAMRGVIHPSLLPLSEVEETERPYL